MPAPLPILAMILTIGLVVAPLAAAAQPAKKVPRIGFLANTRAVPNPA